LLDVHDDSDHHRSVFTLAGPTDADLENAVRRLAVAVDRRVDLRAHDGVHPRLGALDVVPFAALDGDRGAAVRAARSFGNWMASTFDVPVFFYGDASATARTLPEIRNRALAPRPDYGPSDPHPRLGMVSVGARPILVAVNCDLDHDDVTLARTIARSIRARDGGLAGVRAIGLWLASRRRAQVSMNLVDLDATGVERACEEVRRHARAAGADVARVELVGLLPATELARCSAPFLEWTGIGPGQTIEARLAALRPP
jgi:glutamate formiminotransferase